MEIMIVAVVNGRLAGREMHMFSVADYDSRTGLSGNFMMMIEEIRIYKKRVLVTAAGNRYYL